MTYHARLLACATLCAGLAALASPAGAVVIVDRGLPDANLNNAAGVNRSNVAWDFVGDYFAIDTFVIPGLSADKDAWKITEITTWFIKGAADNDADTSDETVFPGSFYSDVKLYVGKGANDGDALSLAASAGFTGDTSTDNPNVTVSRVAYSSGEPENDYQGSSGSYIQLYEITFSGLNILGTPGDVFTFGVEGEGAGDGLWFTHASNDDLGGVPAEYADDLYGWAFESAGDAVIGGFFSSQGYGWDKASDLNVIVSGVSLDLPEPGTFGLLGLGLIGIGAAGYRRRRAVGGLA